MSPTEWDCHAVQTGGALSRFQRQVLSNLHGRKKNVHQQVQDRPRRDQDVSRGPGLILLSILVMLPLVMSVYTALHGID